MCRSMRYKSVGLRKIRLGNVISAAVWLQAQIVLSVCDASKNTQAMTFANGCGVVVSQSATQFRICLHVCISWRIALCNPKDRVVLT